MSSWLCRSAGMKLPGCADTVSTKARTKRTSLTGIDQVGEVSSKDWKFRVKVNSKAFKVNESVWFTVCSCQNVLLQNKT